MADKEAPGCSKGVQALTFIKRGGGTILLHSGHQFILKQKYKDGTEALECVNRKKIKCVGKVKLQDKHILVEKKHACEGVPDFAKNEIDENIFKCKKDLSSPNFPTVTSVYNAAVVSHKDSGMEIIKKIPPLQSIKSTLYRSRNASIGMEKVVYKDLAEVTVPKKYTDFLLADYSCEDKRILIFASQNGKRIMANGKDFMGDGTFKSCPVPFTQLYTIHCDIGSTTQATNIVPVAYALLSDKNTDTYEILFHLIKSQVPNWNPITFKTDFELAVMKAITLAFPSVIRKGCYFHFAKAIWKKGNDFGLTKTKITRRQVGLCAVLPYLPQNQIVKGWFYIAAQSPDDKNSKKIREYMLTQWIREEFIPIWCVFGERHRTTNLLEAWHSKVSKVLKKKQPNIVELLNTLRDDAFYVEVISQRMENEPKSMRTKTSILWDDFIHLKTKELLDENITVGHFLETLR